MTDVYISFHRRQWRLARAIAHLLASEGRSVWWDEPQRRRGRYSPAAVQAMNACKCLIALWSKASVEEPLALGEANAAYARRALLSVLTDAATPPPPFDAAPVVDLRRWSGEPRSLDLLTVVDIARGILTGAPQAAAAAARPDVPPDAPPPEARDLPPRPAREAGPDRHPGLLAEPLAPSFAALAAAEAMPRRRGGGAALTTLLTLAAASVAGVWYWRPDLIAAYAPAWAGAGPRAQTAGQAGEGADAPRPPARSATIPAQAAAAPTDASGGLAPLAPPSAPPALLDSPAPPQTSPLTGAPSAPAAAGRANAAPAGDGVDPYAVYRDRLTPAAPRPVAEAAPPPPPMPAPPMPAPRADEPAPPPPARLSLARGGALDFDGGGPADLAFGPDSAGAGLFLFAQNGARFGGAAACGPHAPLRDTLLRVRRDIVGLQLCVRTGQGRAYLVRVDGFDTAGRGERLTLSADQRP